LSDHLLVVFDGLHQLFACPDIGHVGHHQVVPTNAVRCEGEDVPARVNDRDRVIVDLIDAGLAALLHLHVQRAQGGVIMLVTGGATARSALDLFVTLYVLGCSHVLGVLGGAATATSVKCWLCGHVDLLMVKRGAVAPL